MVYQPCVLPPPHTPLPHTPRRNGKPTSLGCFNTEEDAARAYDMMMVWGQLHQAHKGKGTVVTNFDPSEYDRHLGMLQNMSQDQLLEHLRSQGRSQAAAQRGGGGRKRGRAELE